MYVYGAKLSPSQLSHEQRPLRILIERWEAVERADTKEELPKPRVTVRLKGAARQRIPVTCIGRISAEHFLLETDPDDKGVRHYFSLVRTDKQTWGFGKTVVAANNPYCFKSPHRAATIRQCFV